MNAKQIAKKIEELTKLIGNETSSCGTNPLFYVAIAKAVLKTDMYATEKLHNILNMALVMKTIGDED
jgi:hypothetical protein